MLSPIRHRYGTAPISNCGASGRTALETGERSCSCNWHYRI